MSTTMLHVRMDEETKDHAHAALKSMGLTVSEAVRLFLHKVAAEQALPFEIRAPNAATRAAMEEARVIAANRRARYASAKDLIDGLETQGAKPKARRSTPLV